MPNDTTNCFSIGQHHFEPFSPLLPLSYSVRNLLQGRFRKIVQRCQRPRKKQRIQSQGQRDCNYRRLPLGERKRIVELAGKFWFPAIYFQQEFVDEGGPVLTGVDFDDLYKRAAVYVEKIFWLTFYKSLSYKNFLKIERSLVSPVFGIITIASGPRRW